MKILVVDDDPEVLSLCLTVLETAGYQVKGAGSADGAVGLLAEGWDLVIADVFLPGPITGLDLVKRIGERSDVIVMTAQPSLESSIQAIHAGVFDYLPKPFSVDRLLESVRACAERGRIHSASVREGFLIERLKKASQEVKGLKDVEQVFAGADLSRIMKNFSEPGHGRKLKATALFADVRWFTPFAASVGPEDAVIALNERLGMVVDEVSREGGMVNKFLGDGALAVFGAPEPQDDQASRAARAAVAILRRTDELASKCIENGQTPLRLGIGINTGEVVAGLLGTRKRMEYTVIGHGVNVSARLCEIARPNQILLGPDTVKELGSEFKIESLGKQDLAGVPVPLEISQLVWR